MQWVEHSLGVLLRVLILRLELLVTVYRFSVPVILEVPKWVPLKNAAFALLTLNLLGPSRKL